MLIKTPYLKRDEFGPIRLSVYNSQLPLEYVSNHRFKLYTVTCTLETLLDAYIVRYVRL